MGFLDKVKETAATAQAAAKDAAQKGQAKIEDVQAKRAADAILRDLGAAVYAQQTGRATATTDSDIQNFLAQLQQHEATHGPISLTPEAAPQGQAVVSQAQPGAYQGPPPTAAPAGAPAGPPPAAQPMAPPAAQPMAPPSGQPLAPPSGQTL